MTKNQEIPTLLELIEYFCTFARKENPQIADRSDADVRVHLIYKMNAILLKIRDMIIEWKQEEILEDILKHIYPDSYKEKMEEIKKEMQNNNNNKSFWASLFKK